MDLSIALSLPGFTSHQTVARTAGNILVRLADTLILPLNVTDYREMLEQMYKAADQEVIVTDLANHNISLGEVEGGVLIWNCFAGWVITMGVTARIFEIFLQTVSGSGLMQNHSLF